MTGADARWMRLALSLGARGQGRTWPNPAVGCVIVKGERVLGRGWTAPGGRPHAEPRALDQAGAGARGATAYVSLEPCAHHGQTPPCAEALIAASVARVVVAMEDPDPRTRGQGVARLRDAGIAVTEDVLRDEAARAHAGFVSRITQGRPALTLKLAGSFDGRIATASGESRWITGALARRVVHGMRARHDAVMVGAGTVRTDDPNLTVRGLGVAHQPVRVVISRRLDLPSDSVLAQNAHEVPLWLCHGEDAAGGVQAAWRDRGARLIPCATAPGGQLDLSDVMQALGREGLTRVFCEGGGVLAASLLTADLVDDLVGFTAGLALGAEGQPAIGAMGVAALGEAPRFILRDTRAIGPDILHSWTRGPV
ncbi:bifunctional diaminohydroxyphosphoribosylaminopyrimidine deaminase/5-amino-6-(5-phosphoribosylamino)uracil reductase RibD [Rhodophyticola porphyridii]|uniref:bifunctional diaminohydroxyphosphoribosylaminopyrimidine deaminase/5-amino-6-(5-phosphoribosylamino)uracil reductase RibD n=1 Tax=Rhodophyticola porphyridii TaxID=1852017 RepID=UPI0035D062B2